MEAFSQDRTYLPANASFVNTTAPNNGSIVIDGSGKW
jgi:hypothetical protein